MGKEFWFSIIIIFVLIIWLFKLLLYRTKVKLNLNLTDLFVIIFVLYCVGRTFCFNPNAFFHNYKLHRFLGGAIIYFFAKNVYKNLEHIKYFLAISGFFQAFLGLLQLYDLLPSYNSNYKITGTFNNPAPYALYLAAILPIAIDNVLKESKIKRELNAKFRPLNESFVWINLLSIIFVLPLTMIRASWVGAIIGSILLISIRYNLYPRFEKWLNTQVKRFVAIATLLLLIFLFSFILLQVKLGSTKGRLLILEITITKTMENPLFGFGLGQYESKYNTWQAEYFQNQSNSVKAEKGIYAGNTKYAFNEYLEMASEIGILGLFLFLAIFVSAFRKYFKMSSNLIKSIDEVPLLISISVILICALISIPFYSLPTLILFFTLLGILSSNNNQNIVDLNLNNRISFILISVICFLLSEVTIVLKRIPVYKEWNTAYQIYQAGHYQISSMYLEECSKQLLFEGELWQLYGKSLQMQGDNIDALQVLKRCQLLTSDIFLYTTIGDVYKSLKLYEKARLNYEFASFMQPHMLYPHYLLAKLYLENQQKENAISKAKEVLIMKEKVPSMAVTEIKNEMKRILNLDKSASLIKSPAPK